MIIKNECGLPESFVRMATSDYVYKDKQYSATALIDPIRCTMLKRRHNNEIEEDVSNMIWMLFGTAIHSVLEHAGTSSDELAENKLVTEIKDGYKLSGVFDLYSGSEHRVKDYKSTSVYKVLKEDYSDWRKQLLMYAWLLRKIGFECDSGEIVAIMRDHQKSKAKFDKTYPQLPVKTIIFKFGAKDFTEIEKYIYDKFDEIIAAEKLPDDELPLCSLSDRFNDGFKYAVKKNGRKTALRVLDTKENAEQWLRDNGGDFIEERPGVDKKCLDYCSCAPFCDYWIKNYGSGDNYVCEQTS